MQRRSGGLFVNPVPHDLLQATWHGTVVPLQLLEAAESSLKQCVDLDWKLIKKHHWLLHFHQMLSKHQCIPNTFCMERKNKMPGRIATLIQNLSNFEWSVYYEVLTLEMERLSDPDVFAIEPGLLQAKFFGKEVGSFGCRDLAHLGKCQQQQPCQKQAWLVFPW